MLRELADLIEGPRTETHGDARATFRCHGELLMTVIDHGHRYHPEELAGLAHITGKLARYIVGDRYETEHLRDLAGYVMLLAALMDEQSRARREARTGSAASGE